MASRTHSAEFQKEFLSNVAFRQDNTLRQLVSAQGGKQEKPGREHAGADEPNGRRN